jgi:two-component system chemotaxis response regulator CheY
MPNKPAEQLLQGLNLLIVDSNSYTRRLTRMMLANLGIKSTIEAATGVDAIHSIRTCDPDVMLLEGIFPPSMASKSCARFGR